MKLPARLLILSACLLGRAAFAGIVVPGANGTDGALTITEDTVIDLSQAPTGTWDQDNTANAGKGVYDPEKWAVVFKYTDVTIASGKKVTFKNNASRAPVVWLVSGNVSIAGTVDLSGGNASSISYNPVTKPLGGELVEPGPGGFRGGGGWRGGNVKHSAGFGPGGGRGGIWYINFGESTGGSAAGFGSSSTVAGMGSVLAASTYGNPSLIPLIGGSGGSGDQVSNDNGTPGAAGGGAILIACAGNVSLTSGQISVKGGDGGSGNNGSGSGGGIRIVCAQLLGTGVLSAVGGAATGGYGWSTNPGNGRIRLERVSISNSLSVFPAPSSVDLTDSTTAVLWPPTGSPKAKILSVNSIALPDDPKASFGTYSPDAALPLVASVEVIVETENVEAASQVIVRITPRNGMAVGTQIKNDATEVTAVLDTTFTSPSPGILRWKATVPTLPGHSAVQARIIRP